MQTAIESLRRDGYAVVEDLLEPAQLERLNGELEPHFGIEGWGRNDFEGLRTERVYSMLVKCPSAAPLVEHPAVLAILDAFLRPSRLLSACQATRIHPGEDAQALHADDELGAGPRPREPQSVSVMWALDEFSARNGSTLIVPGSHLWRDERRPDLDETISLPLRPGAALFWLGGVYHGGGPNRSDGVRTGLSNVYFQPWLRQIENMTLAVPPEIAKRFSPTVQRMLGYSVTDGAFYGHVNGRDPIKLLTRDVRASPPPETGN